jgi:UDP-N-acetylenolpyruvoylglucosamine reductase
MDLPLVKGRLERDYPLSKLKYLENRRLGRISILAGCQGRISGHVSVVLRTGLPLYLLGRGSNVLLTDGKTARGHHCHYRLKNNYLGSGKSYL